MRTARLALIALLCLPACAEDGIEPADGGLDSGFADAGEGTPQRPDLTGLTLPLDTLSAYGFFVGELAELEPAPGVVAYAPASPLWADHAAKGRFVYVPEGEQILIDEGEDWVFPDGTVVIKTFFLDLDRSDTQSGDAWVVETRLMIREAGSGPTTPTSGMTRNKTPNASSPARAAT